MSVFGKKEETITVQAVRVGSRLFVHHHQAKAFPAAFEETERQIIAEFKAFCKEQDMVAILDESSPNIIWECRIEGHAVKRPWGWPKAGFDLLIGTLSGPMRKKMIKGQTMVLNVPVHYDAFNDYGGMD